MIPEQIKSLIEKLIEKTEKKKANWHPSSGENSYQISLNSGTITIDSWYNPTEEAEFADIIIYNKNGDRIEGFAASKNDVKLDGYKLLMRLHDAVTESHFRIKETLLGMLDEVEKSDEIGEDKLDNKGLDIDDLPF